MRNGANSFSNALKEYGTVQPGLVAAGYAAIICFAFIALSIDGSTRLGLASALGALFVGVSIAAGFGIGAAAISLVCASRLAYSQPCA